METNVVWKNPGSGDRVFGNDGCSYFTRIEYVQPEDVADKLLLTPPSTSHQGVGSAPTTVKCS